MFFAVLASISVIQRSFTFGRTESWVTMPRYRMFTPWVWKACSRDLESIGMIVSESSWFTKLGMTVFLSSLDASMISTPSFYNSVTTFLHPRPSI